MAVGNKESGKIILNLDNKEPLFNSIEIVQKGITKEIVKNVDPVFLLTVGKRDLISQNGWNIFFDKVPLKPHESFKVNLTKKDAVVSSAGARTIIKISGVQAQDFKGWLEITLYNGTPLFNVAAVMLTSNDSTAIVYDAGLISKEKAWNNVSWANVYNEMQVAPVNYTDTATNEPVKYRTIIGENKGGSIAVFPGPHQYFYPLDETFNLKLPGMATTTAKWLMVMALVLGKICMEIIVLCPGLMHLRVQSNG